MVKVINVKYKNDVPSYAIFLIEQEIKNASMEGVNVIIIIHGYGSSGTGGIIKREVLEYLAQQKKQKNIIDFVAGEHWAEHNDIVKTMEQKFPELILNNQINNYNSGVSVVWIR